MEQQLLSVRDFCAAHSMSKSKFYLLVADGDGPRITRVRGSTFVSAEDARAWRERMATQTEQAARVRISTPRAAA